MLGLKLNHVSEGDPAAWRLWIISHDLGGGGGGGHDLGGGGGGGGGVMDRDQGLLNIEKYSILFPWNFS